MNPDRLAKLHALRDRLYVLLEDASPAVLPLLSRELRAVLAEIDSVPSEDVNPVDDLATRRTDRRAKAKVSDRAAGGDVGG